MIRFGTVGLVGIGMLALRTLDDKKFQCVNMEPRKTCDVRKIMALKRIVQYTRQLDDVDVVMFVFPVRWTAWAMRRAKRHGKKTIVFWIGTDVYLRLNEKVPLREIDSIDLHLCVGERLQKELATLGIAAKCLHAPSDLSEEYSPMPKEHAVLLSIPDGSAKFYGYDYLVRLIRDFPDTKFIVTRSETPSMYPFSNVDFRGLLSREEMDKAFADSTVYIRFPEHDSIGLTVLEALIKGKQVICNYQFPYTHEAHSYEELRNVLSSILHDPPKLNTEGHDYALSEYSAEKCSELLAGYVDELCKE